MSLEALQACSQAENLVTLGALLLLANGAISVAFLKDWLPKHLFEVPSHSMLLTVFPIGSFLVFLLGLHGLMNCP